MSGESGLKYFSIWLKLLDAFSLSWLVNFSDIVSSARSPKVT